MPFGLNFSFGFKKNKSLNSAERFIQQGKITNAIAEYEKVLKTDCKDLTVINTIGDLYARLGDNEKAVGYFRTVGDTYASQGFTVKAIAMYKKIAKLRPSIECVLKLAELYTQQGLHNDARSLYLQVAEQAIKSSQLEQAIRLFQKILEVDPENTALQIKLADVQIRLDRKDDAAKILLRTAHAFIGQSKKEAALEQLKRVLELKPGEPEALALSAQMAMDSGDAQGALKFLEQAEGGQSKPEARRVLLRAYLQLGKLAEAAPIAHELFNTQQDVTALSSYADAILHSGNALEALKIYSENAERLLSSDPGSVVQKLHSCVPQISGDVAALGFLYQICEKAGEASYSKEVAELLAQASVRSGDLSRARDLYLRLVALDPGNPLHEQSYKRIQAQLGDDDNHSETIAERPMVLEELESSSPILEREHPRKLELAIRRAITDAELYLSYNLPAKATAPLLAMIEQAPSYARLNQKLALVYARAGNWLEVGRCCRTLEKLYAEARHPEVADRYSDLAQKYGSTGENAVPAPSTVEHAGKAVPAAQSPQVAAASSSSTREIDLSAEWETAGVSDVPEVKTESASAHAATPAVKKLTDSEIAALVEEVRFYLQHNLWEEAQIGIEKCAERRPDMSELPALRQQLAAGRAPKPAPTKKQSAPAPSAVPAPASRSALGDLASDLEQSLPPTFTIGAPAATQPFQAGMSAAAAAAQPALERVSAPPPVAPVAATTTPSVAPSGGLNLDSELADLFSEFKEDLEDKATASQSEDPETHYNLGVAFREMGLLDEAIGELQKVCQAVERGLNFPHVMQAYTWLAQCFLDKEVPQAAVKWYQKALELPGIEDESRIALHYEIASAFEGAGNKPEALHHFMEVYGSNIDYRDVAERIKALKS